MQTSSKEINDHRLSCCRSHGPWFSTIIAFEQPRTMCLILDINIWPNCWTLCFDHNFYTCFSSPMSWIMKAHPAVNIATCEVSGMADCCFSWTTRCTWSCTVTSHKYSSSEVSCKCVSNPLTPSWIQNYPPFYHYKIWTIWYKVLW